MPPKAVCSCAKHEEWHHAEQIEMRVANFYELNFCSPDTKHGKRKRHICVACRGRISVEEKFRKLTAETDSVARVLDIQQSASSGTGTLCLPPKPKFKQDSDIQQPAPVEIDCGCDMSEPQIQTIVTNADKSKNSVVNLSRGTQVPSLPLRPYQEAQDRTKRDMRSEILETLKSVALKYVHFEPGQPLVQLMEDILQSRSWKQLFGTLQQPSPHANEFLQALAKEFKSCKDKEARKKAKKNSKEQKQKLLIGNTKDKSKIAMFGDTPLDVSSRVEAAKKIGRLCHYGDEKRRLLSIVACDYTYSFLQNLFQCSPNTITAARVHCILFGRGGVPPSDLKFTRQRVSPQILQELTEFLTPNSHD